MTEQTPHNLLHVSATRVSSPEDAAQLSPLSTVTENTPPTQALRDYESLALISQEMNKEHRYLADKRAQAQSSKSFYQMGAGALGGVGAGAFFYKTRNKFDEMIERKANEIAKVATEHASPYKFISQIKSARIGGRLGSEEIERLTDRALLFFCPEEHAKACREDVKTIVTKTSHRPEGEAIRDMLNKLTKENTLLAEFQNNFNKAFTINDLSVNTKTLERRSDLNDLLKNVQKEIEPVLKEMNLSADSIEKTKKYFRATIKDEFPPKLTQIRATLTKDFAHNIHKPAWQIGLGAGAIVASTTLGSLAYNFLHNKDKQEIKKTEEKIDTLGNAFELFNAPNTTVEASSDVSLEKLVNSAEHTTAPSHTV